MTDRKGWMWLSLGLALITGASAGVIGDRFVADEEEPGRRPPPTFLWFDCSEEDLEQDPAYPYKPGYRRKLVERLDTLLELDAQQVSSLEQLLDDKRDDSYRFWSETRDRYCGLQTSFRVDIRALLSPEQAETYDRLVRKLDERHRKRLAEARRAARPASRSTPVESGESP